MKLYLAGMYANRQELTGKTFREKLDNRERAARLGVRYFLESYHYISKQAYPDRIKIDNNKIFLDSGAFSAYTKSVVVNIEEYCEFIKRNWDIIENVDGDLIASVLDSIGDCYKTWENQMKMESLGVRPLPCFHFGEDLEYLKWYVDRYTYITLGGMAMTSAPNMIKWLDFIWDKYLTNSDGSPKVKVHGFALTNIKIMGRYPWYSVDSSSWIQYSLNGYIYVPALESSLMISDKKSSRKEEGHHFDTLTPLQHASVTQMIEKDGFKAERMRVNIDARSAYNQWAYTMLNDKINNEATNFVAEQPGLF